MSIYAVEYTDSTMVLIGKKTLDDLVSSMQKDGIDILMKSEDHYGKIAIKYYGKKIPDIKRVIGPLKSVFMNITIGVEAMGVDSDDATEWLFIKN